jgi:type III restriction enzyme
LVVPQGEVRSGYHPFSLDLGALRYPQVDEDLWIQHLRTGQRDVLSLGQGSLQEARLEDTIVSGLVDFDDVAYDQHADLLYDLARQTVEHFRSYLPEEEIGKVLRVYQKPIANLIHVQMQSHFWEDAAGYDVRISRGFTELRPSAYTAARDEAPLDFHESPADRSNMARYLFGGFQRCLYAVQKFQSDAERRLAVILERDTLKWFKPARGQFQIFYKSGADHLEYQPDFVAETDDAIYMLEPKARNELDSQDVLAKQAAAVTWCQHASTHALSYGGKPWQYVLIPHDVIADNMTLEGLAGQYRVTQQLRTEVDD